MRLPRWPVALLAAGMLLTSVAVAAPPAGTAPAGALPASSPVCSENPFTSGFAAFVAARWPANRISAAVYDGRTGCEYTFRPDLRLTTASVIKIEIMAAVLLRAQRAGRGLTQWEQDRIWPMITESADTPASELWWSLGGTGAMAAFERELGLTQTVAAGPTWGLTTTSASDRNRVLRQVLLGEYGPLNATSRAIARSYMLQVVPSQRWGATAGVPAGWAVPLKNGFFDSRCCNWRINTSAVIERSSGTRYALTVMSDGWSYDRPGIEAVEFVSRVVHAATATPFGPFASPARFVRQQYRDVLGREPTFRESYFGSQYMGLSTALSARLISKIIESPESARSGVFMMRLYLGALHRQPAPPSFALRRKLLVQRQTTPLQQAEEFAAAAEFTGAGGLDHGGFVDRVYQRVLGRAADASGRAYWVGQLGAGVSRGAVLLSFVESGEGRAMHTDAALVSATVQSMMGRVPTADGLATWTHNLATGTPLYWLTDRLFRSSEYGERVS